MIKANKHGTPAEFVAQMSEDEAAKESGHVADCVRRKRQDRSRQWIERREEKALENQGGERVL